MKTSKTSISGTSAAAFYAAAQVPGLPEWLQLCFKGAAAISIAALGYHSTDCPVNCPGTDDRGRPLQERRQLWLPALLFVGLVVAACLVEGCITRNPSAGPNAPGQPAYIVAPALMQTSNTLAALAETAGKITGTGPLFPIAASGVFAAVGALSALWARHKSQIAATIADGVVAAGPAAVQDVVDATRTRSKGQHVRDQIITARQKLCTAPPPQPST